MDDDATRQVWSRGSYAIVGDWFAEASRRCLEGLELDGARVLDVACGTGAVAIAAARAGARVVGLDLTPSMLEEAARRADAAGVAVTWEEGSFTDLSAHRDHDVVTSAFGVIFAEDQAAVAAELLAALRPGGTAAIAGWTPGGAFGALSTPFLDALPGLADRPDGSRWVTPEGLEAILAEADALTGRRLADVEAVDEHVVHLPFPSVDEAVHQMRRWSGPWMALFDAMAAQGLADVGHAALVDHLAGFAEPAEEGDGVVVGVGYRISRLRRT